LAVLADLLADLPSPQRREVIASLPTEDRAAIARLIAGGATG
jgi:Mg/Co/Ni transporter MgtE